MSGEFKIAQQLLMHATEEAQASSKMSENAMDLAVFSEIVAKLSKTNTKQQLTDLLHFQLESQSSDEHVITRGC